MFTNAKPPRMNPTKTFARLIRRIAIPPSAMMPPASTKNGMASNAKSSVPSEIFSITASSGMSTHIAPISADNPSAYATGTPSAQRTANDPSSTRMSIAYSSSVSSVAIHHRSLRRAADPDAFDQKNQREQPADGNRRVDERYRQPRKLRHRLEPCRDAQLDAVEDHEQRRRSHARIHCPHHRAALSGAHRIEQRLYRNVHVRAVHGGPAQERQHHHQHDGGGFGP